jgi:hypothetical protein
LQTQPESNHVGDKTGTHKIRNVWFNFSPNPQK